MLGIRQCRSNDRPLLLQSCRDDTPCTDDQTIYEHHLSDRLWEHEGRVWIGRCRGGARFIPLQCARPNVLGIQPWSSNDRPPWLQSCRDNIPCTHDQAINEHVSDMLWGHGGQGKSGRRPGEGWRPFAVAVPMCWAFGSRGPSTGHYCSNLVETTPCTHAKNIYEHVNDRLWVYGGQGSRDGARVRGGAPLLCGALMLRVSVWHAAALNPPPRMDHEASVFKHSQVHNMCSYQGMKKCMWGLMTMSPLRQRIHKNK